MGIITLTDRISVSVRAKNETESNSQKRATGKNIAKALGNDNISDSLADQIGATAKPTITDEQGREWVSMADIIAAGKKMKENGAFDGPEYDDYVHNGYHYYRTSSLTYYNTNSNGAKSAKTVVSGDFFYALYYTSSNRGSISGKIISVPNVPLIQTSYSLSTGDIVTSSTTPDGKISYRNTWATDVSPDIPDTSDNLGVLTKDVVDALLSEQPVDHHGGSLIDWTKPDDEIEEDIRNLHETWDVSDHAGSTTANGTYVLAGPIEFNPGD